MNQKSLNIQIETLLYLPGNFGVFWKDSHGHYMGCNDFAAEKTLLSSRHDVVGRSDFDLTVLRHEEASAIREGDQTVLKSQKTHYFLYSATGTTTINSIFLTIKAPLWNKNRKMVGIYGFDYFIDEQNEKFYFPILERAGIPVADLKRLQSKINLAKKSLLSKRQIDCLYYLVRGMTLKEIGIKLKLSPKTVEHYITAIKVRLQCRTRSELVNKALSISSIKNTLNL